MSTHQARRVFARCFWLLESARAEVVSKGTVMDVELSGLRWNPSKERQE